ncbi:30S ribosomal protein S15 [candidate division MSBL1 archaeon SCGC-AAA259I09]|uniref:30S ribosomal protein S15 n=4 Tax=candidate division MSBL1 TaxID=215777 RepID=A0A133UV81_9EURY|nr:30S ribosomal protein S15 [candidate division MSBL1 archaeon SCGC-AAA259D14]KXA92277.1 30S ribosomal protein S15 [candidate division MSBL1 archaeon SCGC-AAA259E22]KXA98094.1 30S ribosomal protein S15 [candidate division MSBL1 archaeon SCGC-AAA259I09]KXA98611.1 30S ribosomal protein S15 [candidate division MSBL1 archaeon SCGC-AAA259J03]
MPEIPKWIDKNPEEIEELIVELAEEDNPPSKIGMILRDQYGIPKVKEALGKNMVEILKSHGLDPKMPEDLMNLLKKAVKLRNHLEKNPKDLETQRTLDELESNIKKITKYYKKKGRVPEDWRYDPEKAALLVQG